MTLLQKTFTTKARIFSRLRGYLIKIFKLTPILKPVSHESQRRCAALA
jgi:hypothetical protein